jgi:hypothetical protein
MQSLQQAPKSQQLLTAKAKSKAYASAVNSWFRFFLFLNCNLLCHSKHPKIYISSALFSILVETLAEWQLALIGTVIGIIFAVVLISVLKRLYLYYLLYRIKECLAALHELYELRE